MYASAFDLRPLPGEMVVSRSDVKRRRKEGNVLEESIQGSPKRTKVHAQRKFAQGSSNMSSPALTPVKDKDKVKTNGMVLSPELIPAKRPKTEDFLTFLCFRGTPILPPCLDFFNIATVQETPDEEQGSSLGECSRESTRNSRIASASVGSNKLQRSADRSVTEASTASGVIKKIYRSEGDGRRKPSTAVQALRKKYQEQRLAKQRASTLKKLAQKVKGKNMVRTRSSTHNEEIPPSMNTKPSRGNVVKKAVRSMDIVQRKIKSTAKPSLLTRMHTRKKTVMKTRTSKSTVNSMRRDGLRSGGQLPPGSEAGLKSERVLKQPEQQQQPRFKPVAKKKIEKCMSKTFASSVSDFSSDDDQPLAKKMKVKPIERASSSRQLARKVIKRIVSKRMKPRMITRSQQQQQQQQVPEKEQTETRLYTRPSRKTKEAAAIYMELLGRKLITPEAEVDEDSLSIDSFPELPNARRFEQRESEIKARAYEERKEAQQPKEDAKTVVPHKSKITNDTAVNKQKQIKIVKAKKLPMRNRKLPLQKPALSKNTEKVKSLLIPDNPNKKESVNIKENVVNKKQDGTGLQVRPRKISARLQSVDNQFNEEGEADGDKMRPPYAPRRSLRRGSREAAQDCCDTIQQGIHDVIHQASNSESPSAGTVPSKHLSKKIKPVPSQPSSSPLIRGLRKCSRSQENTMDVSEETFSDSDEEPLGKLFLKHSVTKKLSDEINASKDTIAEEKSEAGGERDEVINKKGSKNESKALLLVSDDTKKKNVTVKNEQVLKIPMFPAHKGNDNKIQQPGEDISKIKVMEVVEVTDSRNKELSKRKSEDGTITQNTESLLRRSEDNLITKGREELQYGRSEAVDSRNKEKLLKIIDDNAKKEEIIQRKNKEISCTKNRQLQLRKSHIARNKDISNRRNEESEITKSNIMPKENYNVLLKNKEMFYESGGEDAKNEEISQRKTRECVNAKYKETLLKKNNEFSTKIKKVALRKPEDELQTKKKEMVLRSCEELHDKIKHTTVRKNGGELITKRNEILPEKSEEDSIKGTEITQQTKNDLNNKKIIVPARKIEHANSKNKEVDNRNCEEILNTKIEGVPLKKSEENISKNIEASQRKNIDEINKIKQILQRKSENMGTTNKEIPSKKNEDLSTLNEEILPRSSENFVENVQILPRKNDDVKTKMAEVPSVKNEDCLFGVEAPKSFSDNKYLLQNTWFKSEYISADDKKFQQPTKSSLSFADVEPLTKGKIATETKELVGKVINSKEEKFEPHKEMNTSNKVKNVIGRFGNEILGNNGVDSAKSSHVLRRNLLQLKAESQTVKSEKQIVSNVSNLSRSNKIVPVSNKITIFNTDKILHNMPISVDSCSSEKNGSISKSAETHVQSQIVSHAGIKTSPKGVWDSSDSEDDILTKLPKGQVSSLLSNSLLAMKEEPLSKCPPNTILPTKDAVLKQDSKTTAEFEDIPPEQVCGGENGAKVETKTLMISHIPVGNKVELTSVTGAAISKSDNKTKEKYTELRVVDCRKGVEVRRGKIGPSSQALRYHAKSNAVLNREPTFRDKVKAKVNMSNEQIEKWLNESYIEESDSGNSVFDKCLKSVGEEGETLNNIDFIDTTTTKEYDYRTNPLEEELKSGKDMSSYLREIDDEHLYQPDKDFPFLGEVFPQKVVELPEVTPKFTVNFKKSMSHDVALVRPQSSAESLLMLDEGRDSRTSKNSVSSLVKEPKSVGVNAVPISRQKIEVRSTRNQEENEDDTNKEEAAVGKLQSNICSASALQHDESELSMPRPSYSKRDKNKRYDEEQTHNVQSLEDIHVIEEKFNKLNPEARKQEVNITHHNIKSQPMQDRGGEKKPIFQQRRSFPHKIKERKDLTPSANAFSPENESSVYAFESEPELPPVSTPFRRRARDSRTSSTTTSKSEEDLARLDDETTPPPSAVQMTLQTVQSPTLQTIQSPPVQTVPSSTVQTVQSERLTLPVVGQPIQTLPLSTAIVQIIPTLPITMRPVQVENYVSAQQQQQQQQVLLLQNDAVMTTLKTGCTSSASIAVQVNLDNEPSLDASSQNILASHPATPEPLLQRSMECSTQTDVAEEEEDDNEGHLFYIPLQHPTGTGGPLATPTQQLIQGVAVKLGTEGPTGPNQRVIMRAKLVTKPPTFNRTAVGIQDGNTTGIGRSLLTAQHQRSTGMLMMEQKNIYGSAVGASSPATTGTYPPVGTVQPTARGRPLVFPSSNSARSDDTIDTVSDNTDVLKLSETGGKTADISLGLHTRPEVDDTVNKPLAMVSAKPVVKPQQNAVPSIKEQKIQSVLPSSSLDDVAAPKLPVSKSQGNVGKDRRSSVEANSPNTSSTSKSTAGSSKRSSQKAKSVNYACKPSNTTSFPSLGSPAQMVEAPVFHPSEKEFQDPLEYIDRIRPVAEKFGLCRVVPPPNFKPECKVSDDMRFLAYNQYVHKMLHRWGPNVKEMMAIKKYLATQSISFSHPPWIGGMEVDLPRLYKIVQNFGGLKEVIEKKKWHRVADGMKIPKSAQDRVTKLDDIYCKYLLPYDTLSPDERQKLLDEVEQEWTEREKRATTSVSPGGSDMPEEECEGDTSDESEECIVKGRNMPLNAFYRIARNTMSMWFRQAEPPASDVEQEFWRHVTLRQSHVCVHTGSIDSSGWGYGFPCSKNSPFARHPWNLKVLTNNSGSILRSIGPIMGVTVPTLHVGMLFTTCCWYRDPHGLPWVEYLHTGANKIWYGIPDEYSSVFRSSLTKLVPRYCRNKTIWLPSDTAMVPPPLLVKHGVSLCHTVQEPGQFILVFPRAFTSSICTGYLVSESVYYAQPSWLNTAEQVFRDIQNSCEPSMFSLERLLFSISTDGRTNVEVLKQVLPMVLKIRQEELDYRKQLYALGLKTSERLPLPEVNIKRRKVRQAREEEGDYECEICRANLFVSLVTNSHEEGVYCLPHAIELLTEKRHHLKYCKLMYTYDQAELNELIQKLRERIEAKSQRKSQGKHTAISHKP